MLETSSLEDRQAELEEEPSPPLAGDPLIEFLVKHRWATVVPIVLPMSKGYDLYWRGRHVYWPNLRNTASQHGSRVTAVQEQVRAWHQAGRPGGLLCTSRRGWQTVSTRVSEYKRSSFGVDVDLSDILEIDLERLRVRIEPRVNMGQLTEKLVPLGYTIPVVPELDDLTASGLVMGYGIESSSHKYGLFGDTVRNFEVVLGNGRVVTASKAENPDLFHALPWSYGAHGLVTAMELPLIPCKPYVRLTYYPVYSLEEACDLFTEVACAENPAEFVEGLMFTRDRGVIMVGDFADRPAGHSVNAMGRWYKPWFYKYAESMLERGLHSEYVPLRDWYHRHTRSLFFHGELLVPFGNEPAFRYPLGWLMPPKVSFMKLTQTKRIREYRDARNIVQDALVPIHKLREGIEFFHREFECYPLWLCPHLTFRTEPQGMLRPSDPNLEQEMFVDIGAWQVPGFVKRGEPWDAHSATRRMEKWLREIHGYQCLYAVTEQTREEFWQMFDPELYDRVREKYAANGVFLDVYDKVKRSRT